ncbi:MAG: hypothetical protein Q7U76_12785 [Nitrospirota bacterium]|nr:hypothetical protein [Nitrospirota bacterium]
MNREQTKYLKDRLSKLNSRKYGELCSRKSTLPQPVATAKRIVKQWEAEQAKECSRRNDRLNEAYSTAIQSIIFGEPGDALKALKEFEQFKP